MLCLTKSRMLLFAKSRRFLHRRRSWCLLVYAARTGENCVGSVFFIGLVKKTRSVWEVKGGRASLVPLSSRSTQGMAPFWEASPVACEKNARKSPVVIRAAQRRAIYLFGIIRPHKRFWGKFEAWCLPPYPISLGCILLQRARTLRYEWKPLSLYYVKRLNIF